MDREDVRSLAHAVTPDLQPVIIGGQRLAAEQQWSVLVAAVAWGEVHLLWPKAIPVRDFLPPVGVYPGPYEEFKLPIGLLMATARGALARAEAEGRIPASIALVAPVAPVALGGGEIGPAALLRACARAIPKHFRARWPASVQVEPAPEPWSDEPPSDFS